jgi:hypothetical protein
MGQISKILWKGSSFNKSKTDRTECFDDDNFPCKRYQCDIQHICNWLRMYILYLHMKADRARFIDFVTMNSSS